MSTHIGDFTTSDYIFYNFESDNSTYKIDIDFDTNTSDAISIQQNGSASGEIRITDINFNNLTENSEGDFQIIKNGNNAIYLNIDDILADTTGKYHWVYEIDKYTKKVYNDTYLGEKGISLTTKTSENDSIRIFNTQEDTLKAINQFMI